eukprot:COSAG06_NODE_146_length_22145_cov_11.714733_22_plen_121_part_00
MSYAPMTSPASSTCLPTQVRKTNAFVAAPILCFKTIILPRQARDKRRESTQNREALFFVGETKNLAKQMPALAASMKKTLDSYLPYVPALSPQNLACYNCSFDPDVKWDGYPGPSCIAKN